LRKTIISIYKTSILTGALFFLSVYLSGQDTIPISDSIPQQIPDSVIFTKKRGIVVADLKTDSLNAVAEASDKTGKPEWKPDPYRSTILSAVLPGLGQAYNRKYWKIPIIYTAGGVLYYYFDLNNKAYLKNKKDYEEEILISGENSTTANEYRNNYQEYRKKRDYKVILMGILYVANIVDAMADAYFISYDISDDLSFKIRPSLICEPMLAATDFSCGITLSLQF